MIRKVIFLGFVPPLFNFFRKRSGNARENAHDEEEDHEVPVLRRRQRKARDCVDEDDFYEIDNQLKNVRPQNMNPHEEKAITLLDCKLSHCAQIDSNRKRLDVRLKKIDDRDKSR